MPRVSARCASSAAYSPGTEISATLPSARRPASAAPPRRPRRGLRGAADSSRSAASSAVVRAVDGDHHVGGRRRSTPSAAAAQVGRRAHRPARSAATPSRERTRLGHLHQPHAVDVAVAARRATFTPTTASSSGTTHVPSSPSTAARSWPGVVITARPPPSTKRRADSIFGPMLPGRELALGQRALGVRDRDALELALPARAVVDRHARHAGEQDEQVGADRQRQLGRAAVLVDDARQARARRASDRACRRRRPRSPRTPASSSVAHVLGAEHLERPRARHHAPPAAAGVVGHRPAALEREPARLARRRRTGRPAWSASRRRGRRGSTTHAREQRRRSARAGRPSRSPSRAGSRSGPASSRSARRAAARGLAASAQQADLRAVAVREHELVAGARAAPRPPRRSRAACASWRVPGPVLARRDQGVPPDGDDDPHGYELGPRARWPARALRWGCATSAGARRGSGSSRRPRPRGTRRRPRTPSGPRARSRAPRRDGSSAPGPLSASGSTTASAPAIAKPP